MGKRGPQTNKIAALEKTIKQRPVPVVGMHETARVVWKRIVNVYPPDHFKPQHFDLLRMYCESAAINKIALKKYIDSEYEDAKWLRVADKMAGRCQGLAVKLGITRNNTLAARGQAGESTKPKSKRAGLLYGTSK